MMNTAIVGEKQRPQTAKASSGKITEKTSISEK